MHQPQAAKPMHCPVETGHVPANKGAAGTANRLTKPGSTEYIAQTVFAYLCLMAVTPLQWRSESFARYFLPIGVPNLTVCSKTKSS